MKRIVFALALYLFAVPLYAAEVVNSGATNPVVPYGDYINFGTKIGSPGYGFRTNNGTIESKNLTGSWGILGGVAYPINLEGGTQTTGILPITQGGIGTNTATLNTFAHTGTSTFPSGVWGNTGNVGIGSVAPLQKAYVAGNVQATGEFIEGTGSIVSTAAIIPYIQLSSTSNQLAATTPTLITYTNADAQQTFSFTPTSGTVTIPENGVYCIIAVGQVGKASGNANRYLDIWLRKNNADIARSGVRNTVREADDAKVVPVNVAMRCNAGDTVTTYMATDNIVGSIGLYYYTPAGEADIPSIITTIYKISD